MGSSKAGAVEKEAESILRPRHQHNGHAVSLLIIVLLCLLSVCVGAPFSTMDSDSEHIQAYNGFYGNPIYRPYGFGSWGVGSVGFGNKMMVSNRPNSLYGGYT